MSTISQSIPNLLLGISQQPDNRKRPGQVKDAQNVFPDFALGMLKRPGGKFIAKLDGAQTRGKWFPILRDGTEKYICQYDTTDSIFRVWNLSDGIRRVVDMGSNSGQPGTCNIPNLFTAFTNVGTAKHTLAAAETAVQVAASDLAKKTLGQNPTLNTLFAVDFRKYSNPRVEDYAERLKEEIRSGVCEIEGNAEQATATVSVSNEITAVGLSSVGSGYESAPTVTISGSGSSAAATAVLGTGVLKAFTQTANGSGYTHRPLITVGGEFSNLFATATIDSGAATITLDGDKRYDCNTLTLKSGCHKVSSGTGTGNGNSGANFKVDEEYVVFGQFPNNATPRAVVVPANDLTDYSTVRVYAMAGNQNNGGQRPDAHTEDGQSRLERLILQFKVSSSEPTDSEWDAVTDNYLVIDSQHTAKARSGVHPSSVVVSDPATIPEVDYSDAGRDEFILKARDITIPAQYKTANVWIRVVQPFFTQTVSGRVDHYALLHVNLIPTTKKPTSTGAGTVTVTTNSLQTGPAPTPATATITAGYQLASLILDNAGSGYNVGLATTIALSGGNPTSPATPTITLTPTFTATITNAGRGYKSATATMTGGGGSGAVPTVQTLNGLVTGVTFTGGDGNYLSDPTITLSAPNTDNPRYAETLYKKDGNILTGALSHVEVKKSGQGLTAASATNVATTTNGNGTGATVDLTVTAGQVHAVALNTNGTGYLTDDEIYPTGYDGVVIRAYGIAKGTERTSEHPVAASEGFKVYELDEHLAPTNTAAELTAATTAYNSAVTTRDSAVTALGTAGAAAGVQGAACAITTIDPNAYLKDATPEDIEFLTLNDYTFVLNKKKQVAMKADLTHQTGLDPHRAQIVIQLAQNSTTYKVRLTQGGTTQSFNHPSGSGASSDSIAAGLATLINADANYTATQVGGTVYVTSSSAFSVETRGGQTETSIYAISDSVSNISLLPRQSKNGSVVRIVNSEDLDIDDMFVKFVVDGDQTFGVGSWEESTAPDIKYKFDELTMPHALVRQADGKFTYEPVNWNDRLVGDNETNPIPSFVDNTISHIFFYRNRMGFLSGQNVILSRAGDLFNFWNTSALTAVNDDPIDISAAGKRPVFLHYVEPTSVGLVLYATNEQFLLATDSDILAPTSAKVNSLSAYECDANVESVSLGTSQAFISKTPLYTRLFELTDITSETPPLMADISNVIPELIPQTIDTLVSSPALSVVSLGATGSSDIFQYRFLSRSRDERLVNCWYKWSLTGTLLTQFFDSSTFFTAVANGSDVYVQSYDMTQSSEEGFLTLPTGEKTDVCLDLFDINPVHSYDSATDTTRIQLPYDAVVGKELNVVVLGGFIGDANVLSSQSVGAVLKPTIQGTAGNQYVDINGDFQGRDLIIGFNYDMKITLPTLYKYTESNGQVVNDDVSSLILHRIKVKTGLSGPVDYKVSITGLDDWDNTVSVTQPNQYQLNNVNMQASSTHVVPVFQRNENLAIQIIGNTPFPVSLLGLDWEGKLNQRFYRRG